MILVDTSIWIEMFGKAGRGKAHINETDLLKIVTCPPVIQELFQGLREGAFVTVVKTQLLALPCVDNPLPLDRYIEAAELYRFGRSKGKTIRSSTDCLIAAIAIKNNLPVWHRDRDFDQIRSFTNLKTTSTNHLSLKLVK